MGLITAEESKEQNKKEYPGRVFYLHFHSIKKYLEVNDKICSISKNEYYKSLDNKKKDIKEFNSYICNSWCSEYSLHNNLNLKVQEFIKYTLQWAFPQAYYSIYLLLHAYQISRNNKKNSHISSLKEFSDEITRKHYPNSISFFASGNYEKPNINNLINFIDYEPEFNNLRNLDDENIINQHIAQFLKTTREIDGKDKSLDKNFLKANNLLNKKGTFLQRFNLKQKEIISKRISNTTIMDIMYRMRIKANYRDIDTFINADIDFEEFIKSIIFIVDYLNFIHEAYLSKTIGRNQYEQIIKKFPQQEIIKNTAVKRLELIKQIK